MFTGLIEETAKILSIEPIARGKRFTVSANKILSDLKIDDSVCVNGVCLTATRVTSTSFTADVVGETLNKSTLTNFLPGYEVNLERSVTLNTRLGGHMVQGHVNGVGTILKVTNMGEAYLVEIELPLGTEKYVVDEGSIAVDGISLTVAKVTERKITLSVIPHTWKITTLGNKKPGDKVNIETDIIGKYIEKLLHGGKGGTQTFTDEWFKQIGY